MKILKYNLKDIYVYKFENIYFIRFRDCVKAINYVGIKNIHFYLYPILNIDCNLIGLLRLNDDCYDCDFNYYIDFICNYRKIPNIVKRNHIEFRTFADPTGRDYRITTIYDTTIIHSNDMLIFEFPKNNFSVFINILSIKIGLFPYDLPLNICINNRTISNLNFSELSILDDFNTVILKYDQSIEDESSFVTYCRDKYTYGDDGISDVLKKK
jgi:hypothetical protein